MSDPACHFQQLSSEHRLFWVQMAGVSPDISRHTFIAIEIWHREHGMTRDRAIQELMCWLQVTREAIGVEGAGHA